MPCLPVHALAFPELTTIARAVCRAATFALSFTGAADTRFVVNVPATAAGVSETISARSGLAPLSDPLPVPSVLMPQNTAAASKPRGAQMESGIIFKVISLGRVPKVFQRMDFVRVAHASRVLVAAFRRNTFFHDAASLR